MVPAAFTSCRVFHMPRRISMSTPAVGSSRISSFGSVIIARAIISRRFMPPDRVRLITSAFSHSCAALSCFSARSNASARGTP